ncbi:MAG TPA: Fur family transcriptional regulator [Dehalococcoidia bacterium]|nr:Fur family transcriptional regulator [Dehalococcoidia bacterium]
MSGRHAVDVPTAADIAARLDREGLRRTEPRRRLIELILQQPRQFRAADLVDRAQPLGIGRATVFRLLDRLVQLGLLSRLHGREGCRTYTLCEPEHHHHLVCRTCGQVTPIATSAIESQIRSLARNSGFRVDAHHLEVFGLCGECQYAG